MNNKLRELVEALNKAVEQHRCLAVFTCKRTCLCWAADALIESLEAEPDGWQPIETAPYGVTVAVSDGIEIDAGWRDEASGMWTAWGGDEMALIPTIYCSLPPLPAPPKGIPNGNS
jgi:hypothetical protein